MKNIVQITTIFIIILVFFFIKRYIKRYKLRKRIKEDGVADYKNVAKNILLSASKSKELYKSLITIVHPDNNNILKEYKDEATELSTKITNAKKNYEELCKLKTEVDEFLKKNN